MTTTAPTVTTTATMAKTTDSQTPPRRHGLTVAYATGALFLAFLAILLFRLEAGLDPAIGAQASAPAVQKRRIIVAQRIVERAAQASQPATEGDLSSGIAAAPAQAPAPTPAARPATSAS